MGLLAPLFLLAGLAIAIPLVVHLRRRDRANVVVFPSLMFLRGGPPPTAKRRRLEHLTLLALRVLAVLLLAFAFARPFLRGDGIASASGLARDVVILIDRSPSMRIGDRFEAARREAEAELASLQGDDRATIVAFADGAESLVEPTGDLVVLRSALAELRPVGGATRYGPAVQLAGRVLAEQGRGRGEVVLIGDLQRVGWTPDDLEPLPPGTVVRARPVASTGAVPPAVRRLVVDATADGARELRAVTAQLDSAADGTPYVLELDGRVVETITASRAPDGGAEARFAAVPIPDRPVRAVVRAATPVPAPDEGARVMLDRGRRREVLVLRAAGGGGEFAATALRAATTPPVTVTVARGGLPGDAELARYSAVVVDQWNPSGADVGRLRSWVERGGGLVVATPPASEQWPAAMADLTGTGGAIATQRPQGAVASVDAGHPAFVLTGVPARELVGARVTRYASRSADSAWAVFARFDDGAPALSERRLGRGRVVVWSSAFDDVSGGLVRQPVFPPLVHALALHAAGLTGPADALRPGDAVDLAGLIVDDPAARADPPREGERLTLAAPDGEREIVLVRDGTAPARAADAGFWEIRREAADAAARTVAVNVDPVEYSTERLAEDELVAAMMPGAAADPATAAAAGLPLAPPDLERRQRLWWWVLAAVATLLAAEILLANRLSRPHVAAPVSGRRS